MDIKINGYKNVAFKIACLAVIVFLQCGCGAAQTKSSIKPVDLSCEYLSEPLGIDMEKPRLSWKLQSINTQARGQKQTAYRIIVAGSKEQVEKNIGDLWDSGLVKSDQSIHVEYNGKALQSNMECFWKVRVSDQQGNLSSWSRPARWTMGLMKQSDWIAKWIGSGRQHVKLDAPPQNDNYLADPWLRKTFNLDQKPERAAIHVASVGYHELYVNGQKISDSVLMPNVADHTKRARYVTYEITGRLKKGKNTIGLWLGTSWSIFPLYKTDDKPRTPVVIAQGLIEMPNGQTRRIVTDKTWKVRNSPNALMGSWMFMNYGGEYYDAGKEIPDWCDTDLNDSDWENAAVYAPKLKISAEILEPNRRKDRIAPVEIKQTEDGSYRVDMGVNFSGMYEIDLRGKPGQVIEMQFSEDSGKMITHKLNSAYRIGPSGKGTFRNRFNYACGRWILIKGLDYNPAREDIRGWLVRTDYKRTTDFECSNELLNRIYNITLWTFENLSVGGYVVDCPQRERMGYGGDAHATTQSAMNNYSLGAFYTKWSQDWRDVQGKDTAWGLGDKSGSKESEANGNIPYTAPTYWGGGGPAWSGYCITLPWYMYRHYGDKRILETNVETIQLWLGFLETKSKDNMLIRWGGQWDFLGDWLWPGAKGVNGDTRETLFFNNCYWIYNLQTAAEIFDVLGKNDIAAKYRTRADEVAAAVHKEFYDPKEHGYVNNLQAYLSAALLTDLPPEDIRPLVQKRYEDEILVHRKGHFWGGITGGYFVVKNLLESDRQDLMYTMATKEDYPGWGDMLNKGATTLWESWEGDNSLLHSSYLHIGAWFIEGLAGIKPDSEMPGYKHFIIKPGVVRDPNLNWVKASFETPYGLVKHQWKISDGIFQSKLTVPANTSATVHVPAANIASVKEGNKTIIESIGITNVRFLKGHVIFNVQPGIYSFECEL